MELYCADSDVPRQQSWVVLQLWEGVVESETWIGSGSCNKAVSGAGIFVYTGSGDVG
jgi:hypothetical protein